MTLYTKLDRRRLLDWLDERATEVRFDVERAHDLARRLEIELRSGQIALLWKDNASLVDSGAPVVLVVADADHDDFLAWASTYISTYLPFTRFFRVLRVSDFRRFDLLEHGGLDLPPSLMREMAGIAVAEAAIQTGHRSTRPSTISLQSCHLTFSFAVLRGLQGGLHPSEFFDLAEAWTRARRVSSRRPLALNADRALSFWILAASALIGDENSFEVGKTWTSVVAQLVRATRSRSASPVSEISWGEFGVAKSTILEFEEGVTLTRERQLRRLDDLVMRLRSSDLPVPMVEAVLGYLLARLSNGSFEYLGLAGEFREDFVCCGLWFALFATWQEGFDGLVIGNSLGRHVAKDTEVSRDLFLRQSANMSLREFLLLADRKTPARIGNITGSLLEIELLPNISSYFPNPFKQIEDNGSRGLSPVDAPRAARLLREALSILESSPKSPVDPEPIKLDDLFAKGDARKRATTKRRGKS
jgi:hypothetical protein